MAGALMPMPAPVRLLSAGVGSPGEAARCGVGGAWARAAVTVVGRAGLHGCGPHREPRVVGQDLHVTARGHCAKREYHRWLPASVRAATRSVRTTVPSRHAKGLPLRRGEPSRV